MAKRQQGFELKDTLRNFFTSYVASHIALNRARPMVSPERLQLIDEHLHRAVELYEESYRFFDPALCKAADAEANDIVSSGLRSC